MSRLFSWHAARPALAIPILAIVFCVALACYVAAVRGQSPSRGEAAKSSWERAKKPAERASYRPGSTAPGGSAAGQGQSSRRRGAQQDPAVRQAAAVTPVSTGMPAGSGQIWKTYLLSAYTNQVDSTRTPQQAVVDWILRETGYEVWHTGETFGVLWADRDELRVYHTPEMQTKVEEIVRRFTTSAGELKTYGVRVVTLEDPNWRAPALRSLRSIPAQTQGVAAWLLEREEAALIMSDLARRTDFREHTSPNVVIHNGQPYIDAKRRSVNFVKDIVPRREGFPWYETVNSQVDEGFALEFSPLASVDGKIIDAVVKLHVDQVERIRPVDVQVVTPVGGRENARMEVPQVSQFRVQERFRWPSDKVLLVSLGMVPAPHREAKTRFRLDFLSPPPPDRVELLLLIESKQTTPAAAKAAKSGGVARRKYKDRY